MNRPDISPPGFHRRLFHFRLPRCESSVTDFHPLLSYGLYPLLFVAMATYAWFELSQPAAQLGRYYGYYTFALISLLMIIEAIHPLRTEWKMTTRSFFRRDLPWLAIGAVTLGLAQYAAGWLVIKVGIARGTAHQEMPLIASVVLALLITDFAWYWVHRWSHEARGPVGRFLWKLHVAHHLPQQVYVLMHAVAHPLNALVVRAILTVPLFYLGFSTEAVFVTSLVVGLQGLVSHFNVDMRTGWWNYVLVGTELHRNHHSADPREAKNYGATIPLWDLLFGTFYYRPKELPQRYGVVDPERYPQDRDIVDVLLLPFRNARNRL